MFTAIKYDDKKKWKHHKSQILLSMSIMNNTIPKATKVLVVYSEIDEIKTTAENFGFEVITVKVDKKRKKIGYLNAAIDRYLQLETYLNQHEGEFDRIAVIMQEMFISLQMDFRLFQRMKLCLQKNVILDQMVK